MQFIGEYLKNIREKENIKLQFVSDELKISLSILKDIEKDYYPDFIDKVFLIGHIRSYAKYLNINANEAVHNFKVQNSYIDNDRQKKISNPIQNISLFTIPRVLSYFSVIVFASSFYYLFIKSNNFQTEFAMTPNVPENLTSKLEEIEMNLVLSKINNKNKDLISIQQKIITENQSDIYQNSSSVIASLLNEKNINKLDETISLKFLKSTWFQIRDKNDIIILSKLMDKGDEYSYQISDNFTLTAGNAGNIIISLNNKVIGKAGKAGEVLDSLIINKNLNQ